jgi:hypothetical protein
MEKFNLNKYIEIGMWGYLYHIYSINLKKKELKEKKCYLNNAI